MLPLQVVPLLIGPLVGLLLGVIAWGFLRGRSEESSTLPTWTHDPIQTHDRMLLALLVLVPFAVSVFLLYVVLR